MGNMKTEVKKWKKWQREIAHKKYLKRRAKREAKALLNKKEDLSERDIKELMGIHRDTYSRHNGALRRK